MKKFKIFYYLFYQFNGQSKFITDEVIIDAYGKEQAIEKFEDLGIDYDELTIEEIC